MTDVLEVCEPRLLAPSPSRFRYVDAVLGDEFLVNRCGILAVWDSSDDVIEISMPQIAAGNLLDEAFHRCRNCSIPHEPPCWSLPHGEQRRREPVFTAQAPSKADSFRRTLWLGIGACCSQRQSSLTTRQQKHHSLGRRTSWHHIQVLCHSNSYSPSHIEPCDGSPEVKTHLGVPPLVRRHRRRVLPHKPCVTACALPRTGDFGSEVTSTALRQVHTARQPFRRGIAVGTTRYDTNESPLPCREHRSVATLRLPPKSEPTF